MGPTGTFESAVPFYARYRSGYPEDLLDVLAARVGLGPGHLVLDIGCGTGQMSIPLARRAGQVVAIDPVAGMLDSGRAAASRAGVSNIDWRRADSSAVAKLGVSQVRLAVLAASFHWTDRSAVLEALDGLIATDGAVVVIADGLGDDDQPDWANAIADVRTRYLGAGSGPVQLPLGHREVLAASPFSAVEAFSWSWRRELTVDEVVGLQFSYSFSTAAVFGERAESFAADVRRAVLTLHPSGTVVEPLTVDVLIARRSSR